VSEAIRVPPAGTRGARMPRSGPVFAFMRMFMGRHAARMKGTRGPEPAKFMGFPALVLTTVGAKTGKEHDLVLGAFPDGPDAWLIVASNGGSRWHPRWFHNIAKNPDKVWIQIGDRKVRAHVESLQGAARDQAFAKVVAIAKNYGDYQTKTDREIPVIRVTPAP
jgi:deazaflavin-dependent oxidoreductase (nitroreductase family)